MTPDSYDLHFKLLFFCPTPLDPIPSLDESETFFCKCRGGHVFGLWTSNRSRITTTRSFSCKLKSQINDDLYFTNLTQILKIHVDFRVISQHYLYNASSISEASELCAGPENRDNFSHFSWKTGGKRKIKIWEFNLILISGTAYFKPKFRFSKICT